MIARNTRMDAFNASAPAFLEINEEDKGQFLKGVRSEKQSAAPAHGVPSDPAPGARAVPAAP